MKIDLSGEFRQALAVMEDGLDHVFITGKAGTGKSTLLAYFRETTKKEIVVLAPTGVAALNVQGQTIHSFFGFRPDVTVDKIVKVSRGGDLYGKLDAIVIDEVSMLRADLMDCIDEFLRQNCDPAKPFGGKRLILIGDLYQLPPVVSAHEEPIFREHYESPFFFSAHSIKNSRMELVELNKVYRQTETEFIDILNAIRNNTVSNDMIDVLNKRADPGFEPPEDEFYIWLTPYNKAAQEINSLQLAKLPGKEYSFDAQVMGVFDEKNYPVEDPLVLKLGAQVMLLNNDPSGQWVNGSMGRVTGIDMKNEIVEVDLHEGGTAEVEKFQWNIFRYEYDKTARSIRSTPVGFYTQFPLRPAWAVTIHKSQGKTFDKAVIDMGRGAFSPGQTYVALSRCRSMDGIVLKSPLRHSGIWSDFRVVQFMTGVRYGLSEEKMPLNEKQILIKEAIKQGNTLEIVYLKPDDTKSSRWVTPEEIGEMDFRGKKFLGFRGFCHERKESRTFRVDRILELKVIKTQEGNL
ncbi:MAG: AAA family ATPase [Spirochaetes bacterium GWF1_51_8]|nr:MAG: AAA family ATPase [Spirochaetes bacterium GWF1_51_8]